MDDKCLFWETTGEFGCFSNFSKHTITVDGINYKTTEHYYQSRKFLGTEWEQHIINQKGPMGAAKEGRRRDLPMRRDWDKFAGRYYDLDMLTKDVVMWNALCCKVEQHLHVKETLIKTDGREIIEASPTDPYWGWGANKKGKNMLGILYMELFNRLMIEPGAMKNPASLIIKR